MSLTVERLQNVSCDCLSKEFVTPRDVGKEYFFHESHKKISPKNILLENVSLYCLHTLSHKSLSPLMSLSLNRLIQTICLRNFPRFEIPH